MIVHQTAYDLALIIVATGRPLADVRGLKGDLNRAGCSPDEIALHFDRAVDKAREIRRGRA